MYRVLVKFFNRDDVIQAFNMSFTLDQAVALANEYNMHFDYASCYFPEHVDNLHLYGITQ